MADIVKAPPVNLADMPLIIRELDATGRATEYVIPFPTSPNFSDWSFMQQVGMLKAGDWKKYPIPQVIYAVAYANRLDLDIMQGDVYSTGEGRIATSNKAKIKMALRTNRIKSITTTTVELDTEAPAGSNRANDLLCTVTLEVEGFNKPIVKSQRMSDWFMPSNPNWKQRPEHMLELNTLAHACELVNPTDESDERPVAEEPVTINAQLGIPDTDPSLQLQAQLTASILDTSKGE